MNCFRCGTWPCCCDDGQTIICGESREIISDLAGDIMPFGSREPFDLVFTDPPATRRPAQNTA